MVQVYKQNDRYVDINRSIDRQISRGNMLYIDRQVNRWIGWVRYTDTQIEIYKYIKTGKYVNTKRQIFKQID